MRLGDVNFEAGKVYHNGKGDARKIIVVHSSWILYDVIVGRYKGRDGDCAREVFTQWAYAAGKPAANDKPFGLDDLKPGARFSNGKGEIREVVRIVEPSKAARDKAKWWDPEPQRTIMFKIVEHPKASGEGRRATILVYSFTRWARFRV